MTVGQDQMQDLFYRLKKQTKIKKVAQFNSDPDPIRFLAHEIGSEPKKVYL
jgi:hypothetical protein